MNEINTEFRELKKEIYNLLANVDSSNHTYIQNYIYFAHYPIFSFAESIILLCENKKRHVAEVLLRTLFEVHIDVIYHQLGNSKQRLALSARRTFDERIVVLNEIERLIEKYPNLESKEKDRLFSKSYLKAATEDQERHRQAILGGNPGLEKLKKVSLEKKAELCDEGQVKNAEPGHFGRMYSVIYRQLSPVAHLNMEGLQAFIGKDEYGKIFFSDGDNSDFVAGQAMEICIAFTKDLYDVGVLKGPILERLGRIEKMLDKDDQKEYDLAARDASI